MVEAPYVGILVILLVVLGYPNVAAILFVVFGLFQLVISHDAFYALSPEMRELAVKRLIFWSLHPDATNITDFVEESKMQRQVIYPFWMGIMSLFVGIVVLLAVSR